jgi:AcrR family transcriptional regulator
MSPKNRRVGSTPLSTKEIIERNAITLFSEKGYDATSMREIAESSDVTKPVIYYYFKSKENLCHHLIRLGLEEFRQQFQKTCEAEADDMFDQLIRAVEVHFEFCRGHVEFVRFIYALNFGPDRKKINYDFHSYDMEIFRMLMGLMRRISRAGVMRKGKEEAFVYYLRGIINAYVMLYIDGQGELPPRLARTVVTDIVNGLGPVGAGSR